MSLDVQSLKEALPSYLTLAFRLADFMFLLNNQNSNWPSSGSGPINPTRPSEAEPFGPFAITGKICATGHCGWGHRGPGGKRCPGKGLYFQPTVLIDIEDNNFAAREESFGPIMVIITKFNENDVELVIERANRTEFGLAGGVFSRDVNRAMRVARQLHCGTVFINTYQVCTNFKI